MESATKKKERKEALLLPGLVSTSPPNSQLPQQLVVVDSPPRPRPLRRDRTVRGRHGRVPPRRPAARPRRRRKPPLPPSLSCPSPLPPPPPQPAPSQFASSPSLRRYPRFRSARPPAEVRVRGGSILARRGSRGLFDLLARRGFGPVIRSSFVASVASSASALDAA
jgi:hypothetical protein